MKIIKNGVIPNKDETKRFVCSECGCVFKANKGEYKKCLYWGQVLLSGFTCKCPTCGEYVRESEDAE